MAWGNATLARRSPFDAGYRGRLAQLETHDNPHPFGSTDWEAWRRGHNFGDDAIRAQALAHKGLNRADQRLR